MKFGVGIVSIEPLPKVVAQVATGCAQASSIHSHTQPCTDSNIDSSPYPYPDTAYSQPDTI